MAHPRDLPGGVIRAGTREHQLWQDYFTEHPIVWSTWTKLGGETYMPHASSKRKPKAN